MTPLRWAPKNLHTGGPLVSAEVMLMLDATGAVGLTSIRLREATKRGFEERDFGAVLRLFLLDEIPALAEVLGNVKNWLTELKINKLLERVK